MHHLFISDVHLGAFDKNKDQQLEGDIISLIDYCESHKIYLHVLGDLFDYWMEFPNYIPPLGNNILKRFKNYHANIGHTYYITGNHDCWTIDAFKKSGFIVRKNEAIFTLDRHSVFLMHGDGVENKTYNMPRPLLNKILRQPWFVTSFQYFLSGKRANSLMKWFSDFTRDPADENPEKLNGWARNLITDHNFDVVIFGHDHIARTETFSKGTYINCGAFHKNNTLAEYKNNEFNLVTWNSHLNRLHPF